MITVGQALPQGTLSYIDAQGANTREVKSIFANKRIVLFAVPGAFTPTCSDVHLPGYIVLADQIKAKGIDEILCLSVNDAFVMKAWRSAHNSDGINMLADGDGSFTQALGLALDTKTFGGLRSKRYAMVIENGLVQYFACEEATELKVSDAESTLNAL